MSFEVGSRIGDYEVIGILGTGGMGKVYKVRNTISERIEAMKVLHPNLTADVEAEGRFLREIKLLATLDHPNIAALHTALRVENQLVMIMELLEGVTLAEKLEKGPIPLGEAMEYTCQVLSALGYAHARGVIHRDIKPSNMMLTSNGVVKLMDFGIARMAADRKLTVTGSTLGSLYYMSPEQVKAEELDGRSDLYSLGVALYEMVTGARPFKGDSDYALMAAQLQENPVPPIQVDPTLPPALNAIILMALAKDRAERFQSAEAFRNALENVKTSLGSGAVASVPASVGAVPASTRDSGGLLEDAQQVAAPASTGGTLPVPPAVSATPTASTRSYRGFYMTAGALVAILVILLGATQLPKWHKAKAGSTLPATQEQVPSQGPAAAPASSPPAVEVPGTPTAPSSSPETSVPPTPDQTGSVTGGTTPVSGVEQHPQPSNAPSPQLPQRTAHRATDRGKHATGTSTTPEAPALGGTNATVESTPPAGSQTLSSGASDSAQREQLKESRKRLSFLAARARAVQASFEKLQQEQQAQGLSPRLDMTASLDRMKQFMDGAHDSLASGDIASAQENMDLAEREVENLEKFLGR